MTRVQVVTILAQVGEEIMKEVERAIGQEALQWAATWEEQVIPAIRRGLVDPTLTVGEHRLFSSLINLLAKQARWLRSTGEALLCDMDAPEGDFRERLSAELTGEDIPKKQPLAS